MEMAETRGGWELSCQGVCTPKLATRHVRYILGKLEPQIESRRRRESRESGEAARIRAEYESHKSWEVASLRASCQEN
jgi:hypothetical protein